jgi:hypothetical protein
VKEKQNKGSWCCTIRASSVVGASQAEIRHYLAPDGCKIRSGEALLLIGEPMEKGEFKHK